MPTTLVGKLGFGGQDSRRFLDAFLSLPPCHGGFGALIGTIGPSFLPRGHFNTSKVLEGCWILICALPRGKWAAHDAHDAGSLGPAVTVRCTINPSKTLKLKTSMRVFLGFQAPAGPNEAKMESQLCRSCGPLYASISSTMGFAIWAELRKEKARRLELFNKNLVGTRTYAVWGMCLEVQRYAA